MSLSMNIYIYISRSDFRDICSHRFGRMSWRAQRVPGYFVDAMNSSHLPSDFIVDFVGFVRGLPDTFWSIRCVFTGRETGNRKQVARKEDVFGDAFGELKGGTRGLPILRYPFTGQWYLLCIFGRLHCSLNNCLICPKGVRCILNDVLVFSKIALSMLKPLFVCWRISVCNLDYPLQFQRNVLYVEWIPCVFKGCCCLLDWTMSLSSKRCPYASAVRRGFLWGRAWWQIEGEGLHQDNYERQESLQHLAHLIRISTPK